MILEISKKVWCGREMRLGNTNYKFDAQGKFEVTEDKAKELLSKYDWIYVEGKLPTAEDKAKEIDPADKETIEELYINFEKAKDEIKSKKKEIGELKEEVKLWREKCQELIDGKVNVTLPEMKLEVTAKEEGGDKTLAEQLEEKTFEELKEIYKSMGNTLQGIKSKDQIIGKLVELDNKED